MEKFRHSQHFRKPPGLDPTENPLANETRRSSSNFNSYFNNPLFKPGANFEILDPSSPVRVRGISPTSRLVASQENVQDLKNSDFCHLKEGTNLHDPPDNWLRKDQLVSNCDPYRRHYKLFDSREDEYPLSGLLEDDPELKNSPPGFIIALENLKKLFMTPYSRRKVSMKVSKIGKSLVCDSIEPQEALHRLKRRCDSRGRKHNFLDEDEEEEERTEEKKKPLFLKRKDPKDLHERQLYSKFLYHSVSKSPKQEEFKPLLQEEHVLGPERCVEVPKQRKLSADEITSDPENVSLMKRLPKVTKIFNRTFEVNVGAHKILLGSNLLVLTSDEQEKISLQLLSKEEKDDPVKCLDMWLDNVMNGIRAIAMCYHDNGVVQNYKLKKTEDIPFLSDGSPAFLPDAIVTNAIEMLEFLKNNCKNEGAAYWLYMQEDKRVLHVYDISDEHEFSFNSESKAEENKSVEEPDDLHAFLNEATVASASRNQRKRFKSIYDESYAKAMMYLRLAINVRADSMDAIRYKRQMLKSGMELIDRYRYPMIYALIEEELGRLGLLFALTYIPESQWEEHEEIPSEQQQEEFKAKQRLEKKRKQKQLQLQESLKPSPTGRTAIALPSESMPAVKMCHFCNSDLMELYCLSVENEENHQSKSRSHKKARKNSNVAPTLEEQKLSLNRKLEVFNCPRLHQEYQNLNRDALKHFLKAFNVLQRSEGNLDEKLSVCRYICQSYHTLIHSYLIRKQSLESLIYSELLVNTVDFMRKLGDPEKVESIFRCRETNNGPAQLAELLICAHIGKATATAQIFNLLQKKGKTAKEISVSLKQLRQQLRSDHLLIPDIQMEFGCDWSHSHGLLSQIAFAYGDAYEITCSDPRLSIKHGFLRFLRCKKTESLANLISFENSSGLLTDFLEVSPRLFDILTSAIEVGNRQFLISLVSSLAQILDRFCREECEFSTANQFRIRFYEKALAEVHDISIERLLASAYHAFALHLRENPLSFNSEGDYEKTIIESLEHAASHYHKTEDPLFVSACRYHLAETYLLLYDLTDLLHKTSSSSITLSEKQKTILKLVQSNLSKAIAGFYDGRAQIDALKSIILATKLRCWSLKNCSHELGFVKKQNLVKDIIGDIQTASSILSQIEKDGMPTKQPEFKKKLATKAQELYEILPDLLTQTIKLYEPKKTKEVMSEIKKIFTTILMSKASPKAAFVEVQKLSQVLN